MRCHYEVLGVERSADEDELKRAYRKQALRLHPDKNPGREAEATADFQLVQAAYAVLSDPQERAWYDSHREAILRGYSGVAGQDQEAFEEGVDVYAYFSASAYSGYGSGATSFYTVFAELFERISADECEVAGEDLHLPAFGTADSDYAKVVGPFYANWEDFVTQRSFHSVDKWDTREAYNRRVKRAMEKENKKERSTARSEYIKTIRQLVRYVKKRDPRVRQHQLQQLEKEKAEQEAKAAQKRQREQELLEKKRAEKQALEAFQESDEMKRLEKDLQALDTLADEMYGADSDAEGEEDEEANFCVACRKAFRTAKQLQNHERSKKHKAAVAALLAELEEDDAQFAASTSQGDDNGGNGDGATDLDAIEAELAEFESMRQAAEPSHLETEVPDDDADNGDSNADSSDSDEEDDQEQNGDALSGSEEMVEDTGNGSYFTREDDRKSNAEDSHGSQTSNAGRARNPDHSPRQSTGAASDNAASSDGDDIDESATARGLEQPDEAVPQQGQRHRRRRQHQDLPSSAPSQALNADIQQPAGAAGKKAGKKSRRRAKKADVEADATGHRSDAEDGEAKQAWRCNVCQAEFSTRNKLFSHISAEGHALRVESSRHAARPTTSTPAAVATEPAVAARILDDEDPWDDHGSSRRKGGKKGKRR